MLTKLEAEKDLAPHLETLRGCINDGWIAWQTHYSSRHVILDARARAAIVYCEIIHSAKTCFPEGGDVKIVPKGSMYVLFIGDDIVLRFKKLKNGVPRNIPTEQQRLFRMQLPIPGILPGTYLSAGYELDALEQAISKTLVVARLGNHQVWSLDLNIGGESIEVICPSHQKGKGRGAYARGTAQKKKEPAS